MNNPAQSNPSPRPSLFSRLFSWRTLRRSLLALAFLTTFIALFYAEEDWRGKRAWEQCKRDLDAKGVNYNWSSIIPPPVPDDQNFFKAPGIDENDWTGRGSRPLANAIGNARGSDPTNSLLIAEVSIAPPGDSGALPFSDTNTPVQIRQAVDNFIGPTLRATHDYLFTMRPLDQIHPAQIRLSSAGSLAPAEIASLFPRYFIQNVIYIPNYTTNRYRVESSAPRSFQVSISVGPQSAADFLDRTRSIEPTLDIIRQALKRPYQRMSGEYSLPYMIPIPNFVNLRIIAQLLADRAKSQLLLHQPEEALRDVLLLHDICLVTESRPAGQPMTLLAAMIHAAIIGLYADTISDGFKTHFWTEPQLTDLQRQLARTDLLPFLVTSLKDERTSAATTLLKTSPLDLYKATHEGASDNWLKRSKDLLYGFATFAPRGWLYQNAALIFTLQPLDQIGDAAQNLVSPEKARQAELEINTISQSTSPYSILITTFRPNGSRAWQSVARNQTAVNEALLACALERYRIPHSDYPETLDALVPRYIDKLPHDLIGGQPLHYRRQSNDTFLLYSIGWNQTDDGGQPGLDKSGSLSFDSGDWVWPNKPQ